MLTRFGLTDFVVWATPYLSFSSSLAACQAQVRQAARESLSQLVRSLDVEDFAKMISSGASILRLESYFYGIEPRGVEHFINLPDACDEFPVHLAVKNDQIDLLEWLLIAGGNPRVKNYWGKTPLDVAEENENAPAVMLLLRFEK